jgi:hypothetical protein
MICNLNASGLCSPSKTRSDHGHSPRELSKLRKKLLNPSRESFSGSASGVIEVATTEIVEWKQWSRQVQAAIFNGSDI